MKCEIWELLVFWLPAYLLYGFVLKQSSGFIRNPHWNNVIDTIMFPYLIFPVLLEALGVHLKKFTITNKNHTESNKSPFYFAIPHIIFLACCIFALVICVRETFVDMFPYNIVVMYWLVVNAKNLVLAIVFMLGRQNYRNTERFFCKLPVSLDNGIETIKSVTDDISEDGLSVVLSTPEFFPPDASFPLVVTDRGYTAKLTAQISRVRTLPNNKWKYCIRVNGLDFENKRMWFQIIYDRHHSLANKIADNWSIFDDYSLNLSKRVAKSEDDRRKLARIPLDIPVVLSSGEQGVLKSFNHLYLTVAVDSEIGKSDIVNMSDRDTLTLTDFPDFVFELVFVQFIRGERLYAINNYALLVRRPEYKNLVLTLASLPLDDAVGNGALYKSAEVTAL
jgi:cellulose synthase (UDP-forming)